VKSFNKMETNGLDQRMKQNQI